MTTPANPPGGLTVPIDPQMMAMVFDQLQGAPDGQMSARLVEQTKEFWVQDPKPTEQEQYDYLVVLALTSCCETSSFVKVLCDLRPHYERPGGPREEPWPGLTVRSTPVKEV